MLRIVLQQLKDRKIIDDRLIFQNDGTNNWYSEVLLPSPFLSRTRKDEHSESWTHAGGVVGKFTVGKAGGLSLNDNCDVF